MNWLDFLSSAKEFHAFEVGLEFEFRGGIQTEGSAQCGAEALFRPGHNIDGEDGRVRAGFFFPRFRSVRVILVLAGALLFPVAFSLSPLRSQPLFFLLAVVERRRGEGDIEVPGGQIIWPRVEFLRLQGALKSLDWILSQWLDGKPRAGRRRSGAFSAILIQQCERLLDPYNAGNAFSPACTERRESNYLAGAVEQRTARIARTDANVRHNCACLDFADDACGDDFVESEGAADGEHALPFLNHRSILCAIQRRRRSIRESRHVDPKKSDIFFRISGKQFGTHLTFAVELNRQIL